MDNPPRRRHSASNRSRPSSQRSSKAPRHHNPLRPRPGRLTKPRGSKPAPATTEANTDGTPARTLPAPAPLPATQNIQPKRTIVMAPAKMRIKPSVVHELQRLKIGESLAGVFILAVLGLVAFFPILGATLYQPESDLVPRAAKATMERAEGGWSWQVYLHGNPLASLLFAFEEARPGALPKLHFAINLGIHLLNAVLLWFVLRAMALRVAFFTAAVFAVHPAVFQTLYWTGYREGLIGFTALLFALLLATKAQSLAARIVSIVIAGLATLVHPVALLTPFLYLGSRLRFLRRDGMQAFNPTLPYILVVLGMAVFTATFRQNFPVEEKPLLIELEQLEPNYWGQQMEYAVTRSFLPFEVTLFKPPRDGETRADPILNYLPFFIFLPPLLLAVARFQRHWARSLVFGMWALAGLLLFFLLRTGRAPGGEVAHEDYLLYFALPAFIALGASVGYLILEKINDSSRALKIAASALALLVLTTVSARNSAWLSDEVRTWENIMESYPEAWAPKLGFARAHLNDPESTLGFDDLQDILLSVLSNRPDLVEVRVSLLNLYRDAGRLEQAERELRRVLQDNPREVNLLRLFADLNNELGRSWEVVSAHERILSQDPTNVESLQTLADIQLNNRRYEIAIRFLERLIDAAPAHPTASINLARAYNAMDRWFEARTLLEDLPAEMRSSPAAQIELAAAEARIDIEAARGRLLDLARQDTIDDPYLTARLSRSLSTLGSMTAETAEQTLALAYTAIEQTGEADALLTYTLGLAHLANGEYQSAQRVLRQGLALAADERNPLLRAEIERALEAAAASRTLRQMID